MKEIALREIPKRFSAECQEFVPPLWGFQDILGGAMVSVGNVAICSNDGCVEEDHLCSLTLTMVQNVNERYTIIHGMT